MYCSLCQRIIDIRQKQGHDYFDDLCPDCKMEYCKRNKNVDRKMVIK